MSEIKKFRCAIYTRKSSEEGLDQAFNSLDAQREACVAYIASITGHTLKTVDTILKHYWAHNEGQADAALAKLIAWHKKQGA